MVLTACVRLYIWAFKCVWVGSWTSVWIKITSRCDEDLQVCGLKASLDGEMQRLRKHLLTLHCRILRFRRCSPLFCFPSVQIFIFENNIYYKSTVESRTIRLVSTGQEGVVFNGLADWLYEGKTLQYSPSVAALILIYSGITHLMMVSVLYWAVSDRAGW